MTDHIYLTEWRIFADLTQEELGARIGYTGAHISRIETGKRDYDGRYLERFKAAINQALDEPRQGFPAGTFAPHVRIRHIGEALCLKPDPDAWLAFSPDLQKMLRDTIATWAGTAANLPDRPK